MVIKHRLVFSVLLGFTVGILILSAYSPTLANPSWWDIDWANRRPITVGAHPENYQIKVEIPSEIPKSDYPSIRFLENETSGLLPYWIERNENEYLNVAWVRRLENSDSTIWMYYERSGASSAENGDNVFLFFDNFGGGTGAGGQGALDNTKWESSSTGVDVYEYALRLEDYNNQDGFVEHGPDQNIQFLNTERVIEFRIKNTQTWRGGLTFSGPGSFGGKKEYAEIFNDDGNFKFFCDGEWSPAGLLQADNWWIGRVDMYSDDKWRARFYWGEDDANYRDLKWTSGEKTNNWNPDADGVNYCDKYRLHVWDGGGNSSYYYDWFFVRKWIENEPSVEVGPEQPLLKPRLVSPADGTITNDNTPLLEWECGENADNHRLLVDNNPDFSSPVENVLLGATDNSYQVTTPLPDDNYSWKVIAINAGEIPSDVWTFVVDTTPPNVISSTPENGATGVSPIENVAVVFSEAMGTNVEPNLNQTIGTPVTYTFAGWSKTSVENDTGTWTHDPWATGENITLVVSDYQDLPGNVGENYTWSFKTSEGFSITVSPDNEEINWGENSTATVTVAPIDVFSWEVSLSAENVPSDPVFVSFSPSSGVPEFTSTMRVEVTPFTPEGTYTIIIKGTSLGVENTTTYKLTVENGTIVENFYENSIPSVGPVSPHTDYPENVGIPELVINASENCTNVEIKIGMLKYRENYLPAPTWALAYRYYYFKSDNLPDENLDNVEITFEVPQSWLDEHGIENEYVTWYRYDTSSGRWDAYPTTFEEKVGNVLKFRTVGSAFSGSYVIGANTPPEVLAVHTLSRIDADVYYSIKVKVLDNDGLSDVDEVWLKLYENSLSQGAPDNAQNHYTFNWIRGTGFSEVGPGASNEHLNVEACSAGSDLVTTDNWTFRVRLGVTAEPTGWNVWAKADGAGHQDNREFANKFTVPYVLVPRAMQESRPPFFENEFEKLSQPVLEPSETGFDSYAIYNPAVIIHNDNFYLFYRAQASDGGTSRIGLATSEDGENFQKRADPVIEPTEWYELGGGCEDCRVVKIENTFWMTYTAYDGSIARLALARSENLENWEKVGLVFPIENGSSSRVRNQWSKSGSIVPEKINGKYYMYFEYTTGGGDLFYATSEDLLTWTVGGLAMERRKGYFDQLTIEAGPTATVLENGILLIYNSLNKQLFEGGRLTTGWVMFSREDPTKIISRCEEPFIVPEYDWENGGQVPHCTFSEGLVEKEGTWYLYYGAADLVIGLATAPVRERSVLWSVETQAEWEEGTWDNEISIRKVPGGVGLVTTDARGWWRFDEGAGLVAHDSSGFGNDGTISGASWTTGKSNNALEFLRGDASDRVEVGDKSSLEGFSEGLTINAWIRPYSKPQSGEIVKKDLVYLLRVNNNNSGNTAFIVWGGGGSSSLEVADGYFPKNQWTMITATWDGYRMRIYKNDAILVGEKDAYFDSLATSSHGFTIGNQLGGGEGFDGKIDEVMVFSRAITEDEIRYLYNHPGLPGGVLSGEWMSAWQDFSITVFPENLEILASVSAGENAWVAVEVSKDGSSVEDNLGWLPLDNGSNTIELSILSEGRYARAKFRLETENMGHSPSVESFTLNGREVRLIVSTDSASLAGDSNVMLKGTLIDLENEETQVWFKWRENGATPWNETGKQPISWRTAFSDNISGLVENKVYEFRAAVEDINSSENTTGPILNFIMDRTLPSAFRLLSPENNVVIPEPPMLEWEASSDNESGLYHYEVWINENNVENVPAGNAYCTAPSLPKGTYLWYVAAIDCLGNRRVSENMFTFTIETPPEPFRLLSPHDSHTLGNMVVLNWENSGGTAYPLDKYQVWINESNVDNVVAGYTYYMTSELPQGTYQWYVVAVDNVGNWRQSENVFTFHVGTPPLYPYRREYFDGFENGTLDGHIASGMEITGDALFGNYSARRTGFGMGYAYVSDVMLGNREENLSVIFTIEDTNSRPGIGFASQDGTWVYAVVDPSTNKLRVERRVAGYSIFDVTPPEYQKDIWTERQENGYFIWGVEDTGVGSINVGQKYRLSLYFSKRSMCVMAVLEVLGGPVVGRVRTVVDVTPEHPLFLSDGPAKFDNFHLDIIDRWVYNWEPCLEPVLSPTPGTWDEKGAFNAAVGIWDNEFRMFYRGNEIEAPGESGQPPDSSLGYATSSDGYTWTKYPVPVLEKRVDGDQSLEDPTLLINPFGDNVHYLEYTDYNGNTPSRMKPTTDFLNFGDGWLIHDIYKTTAILDTEGTPWGPVYYDGENYRFFSYTEGPEAVGFSNDLENWVWRTGAYIWRSEETWSNEGGFGEYPAGAMFMPDGNILLSTCMCTNEGYVGGTEATVGTAIYKGDEPWVLLKRATLPWAPVYYGRVYTGFADREKDNRSWYDGPNFPGGFVMGPDNWVYLYYGGNDEYTGVARTRLVPEFEYRNLMLSKGIVDPGESVVVSLVVRDVGNLDGEENVRLYIDGVLENSKVVALGRDNENTVEFTVTIDEGGVYSVRVGGMSSTLLVVPPMVDGTTPENSANAFVNEDVVVRFNKSMDTSVTPTLTQTSGSLVNYTFSGWKAENTVTTWTHDDWEPGENITMTVSGYEDLNGNVGENYTWSFTTVLAPGKPTLISPADGTITDDNTPLFEWKCGSNADNHRVLIDNDPDFSSTEENVLLGASENSYTPTTPLSPDNYSWRVIAINAYGETESSIWTFVVAKCEVEVTIENKFQESWPCTWLTFNLIVFNMGTLVDNYHLTAVDTTWPPENIFVEPENLENVPPGENRSATLHVHIPDWATICENKEIIVIAESQFCGATDNDNAIVHVIEPQVPWAGTATFSLVNLYTVNVEKILDLNQGSKLVVKFYTYGDGYESENVIEAFSPPWHVEENEHARHPGGIGVKKARLDLTTDDTSNVISTIASFTVLKVHLEVRFTEIPLEWALAPTPEEKTALEIEFSEIPLYWALAPS